MTKKTTTFLFFAFLFLIYYYTSFDRVSFGDCIGYIYIVEKGDFVPDAGSTAHFLYTNSLILFKKMIPLETITSIRLFGSITAVLAIFFLYRALYAYTESYNKSLLGALIFAFSFSFWRMASTIEVCTFNSIFLSAFLYLSVLFYRTQKAVYLNYASLILGLSFWVHVQNIMVIPAWMFLTFYAWKNLKININAAVLLFFGMALSLFIPSIILQQNLSNVYGSANPQWIQGTFTKTIPQYLTDVAKSIVYLIYNFWYFLLPAIYFIFYKIRQFDYFDIFLSLAFLIPFGFGTFYNVSDNYVYFIGPYQILMIYMISGIILLAEKYHNFGKLSWSAAFALPVLYIISYQALIQIDQVKKFDNEKSYKGGLAYYIYPWMINNKGLLEFIIDKKESPDDIPWMIKSGNEYIDLIKDKKSLAEIKKL